MLLDLQSAALDVHSATLDLQSATSECAAMMARNVRRHRPQSPPAPHIAAISLEVRAPLATTSSTTWLVAPVHRQTNMGARYPCSPTLIRWANLPTNRVG